LAIARILWVEGKRADSLLFIPGLRKKGYEVETAGSREEALEALPRFDPDLVVVNAASLRTSGKRICREVHKHAPRTPVLLIVSEADPAAGYPPVNLVVSPPYTPNKLAKKFKPFLPEDSARLLWVKARNSSNSTAVSDLQKKEFAIELASEKDDLAGKLEDFQPNLVVIDISGLGAAGKTACKTVRSTNADVPIVLISDKEPVNAADYAADVVLTLPFTPRKLLNRIKPMLPGDGSKLLHVGPIRLDMELKRVNCLGKETTLTPRLAELLKNFMDHPGEAMERTQLFRDVWNTEYTGDTRTLDVHISWLRQALEEDPRNPRFLKTIRGVGYRLDA
jgi:DNA-binding response OmpR family regulator